MSESIAFGKPINKTSVEMSTVERNWKKKDLFKMKTVKLHLSSFELFFLFLLKPTAFLAAPKTRSWRWWRSSANPSADVGTLTSRVNTTGISSTTKMYKRRKSKIEAKCRKVTTEKSKILYKIYKEHHQKDRVLFLSNQNKKKQKSYYISIEKKKQRETYCST